MRNPRSAPWRTRRSTCRTSTLSGTSRASELPPTLASRPASGLYTAGSGSAGWRRVLACGEYCSPGIPDQHRARPGRILLCQDAGAQAFCVRGRAIPVRDSECHMPPRTLLGVRGDKPRHGVLETAGNGVTGLTNPDVGVDSGLQVVAITGAADHRPEVEGVELPIKCFGVESDGCLQVCCVEIAEVPAPGQVDCLCPQSFAGLPDAEFGALRVGQHCLHASSACVSGS